MNNKARLRLELRAGGPATYTELQNRSRVPKGSFGRTLRALVADGFAIKRNGRYHIPDSRVAHNEEKPINTGIFEFHVNDNTPTKMRPSLPETP